MPLEQRCVRPGRWVIEGWDVRKEAKHPHYGYWVARRFGEVFEQRTLAGVREEVRERRDDHDPAGY
jgi:hypothetical protein